MMKTTMTRPRLLLLAIGLAMAATSECALAQFVWLDGKGVKQYSDMPPPSSIPRNRILKSPNVVSAPSAYELAAPTSIAAATTPSVASATASTKASALMTTAERNADYTKRKMDEAEQAKKSADTAKLLADKKANCERAQSYSRSLEDGTRISSTDKNGERSYMSDEQRAKEVSNTQRVLASCK